MEALKPVLKQKFWILLGVAAIMILAGWWTATASMLTKIKARRDAIDNAFKKVPKDKVPRESWATDLGAINKQQENSIASTRVMLGRDQRAKMMEWPAEVEPRAYLGSFSNPAKEAFRDPFYEEEVKKVWKQVRPLEPDGAGIVDYPIEEIYKNILKRVPDQKGPPPTEKEMWDIKEDLLLLESLFQSIAVVNGSSQDSLRSNDMIHQINDLQLRGGGPKAKTATTGGGSAPPGTGAGTAGDLAFVNPEFNPAEEFGEDGSSSAASRPATTSRIDMKEGRAEVKETKGPETKTKSAERYIVKDENGPFKTRGFYLSVMMDHQKIPQLIAELTANERSKFPVEVIRVQYSRLREDLSTGTPGTTGSSMSGASLASNLRIDDDEGGAHADRRKKRYPGFDSGSSAMTMTLPTNTDRKTFGSSGTGENNSQVLTAAASLKKALNHPSIARVTICGVFTLYQKVALEEATPAATSPVAPAVTPSADNSGKPETTSETTEATDNTLATADPKSDTESESETAEMTDDKPADMPAETESPPEPNTGNNDNPDLAPAKKEEKKSN